MQDEISAPCAGVVIRAEHGVMVGRSRNTANSHRVLPEAFSFMAMPREGRGFAAQPFCGLADLQSISAVKVDQPLAVPTSAVA